MSYLNGQNVLLGVTASIAAYKSVQIVRELIKEGANVKVIQTPASKEFVTPLTLSTLSKNPWTLSNFDVFKSILFNCLEFHPFKFCSKIKKKNSSNSIRSSNLASGRKWLEM